MNARQYKKLSKNKLKQLKVEDGQILTLTVDLRKTNIKRAGELYDTISKTIPDHIKLVGLFDDMTLGQMNKRELSLYIERLTCFLKEME